MTFYFVFFGLIYMYYYKYIVCLLKLVKELHSVSDDFSNMNIDN